jgi:hypothetical protein
MRKFNAVTLFAIVVLGTTIMYGQASRTWVSGVGDDANPCSRTAPCKTWAGAISKTAAGGEIDALDPGGFGAVTITKAITLDGGGGQVASVLVSGTNGIVVQAGPSDVVILRNLRINGIGSGLNGIQFLSGKDLNVENVYIFGFTQNGINIALNQATHASAHILNSVVKNNSGVGIRATNAVSPPVQVLVDNSAAILDTIGIEAAQHSQVIVNRSLANKASSDGLKADDAATADSQMSVDHTEVTDNNNGITATAGGSVAVADCKIANNSGTASNPSGGATITFFTQTNRVHSNGAAGTFATTPQQ